MPEEQERVLLHLQDAVVYEAPDGFEVGLARRPLLGVDVSLSLEVREESFDGRSLVADPTKK